ncbi:MAG: hypothetical protein AB7F53_03095, partial [Nitrososphaeraceae archaeon]
KDIAQIQPYLSSYYEATKYVIDKDNCKKRFSGKIVDITQLQEISDIGEAIIDERKENRIREADEIYKKQKEKAVFFNPGYD